MARKPMVTRTIQSTKVVVLCLDTEKCEPYNEVVEISRAYKDDKILFKVIHKNSMPYMSAFEVGTSFYNPKSLTETHYLTWGHNTPEYLANYPFITVRKK